MAKLKIWASTGPQAPILTFFCPGCGGEHNVSGAAHSYNGDLNKPTFSPSILCTGYIAHPDHEFGKKIHCHSYISEGRIQFLGDCQHALAGQTVDLPEITD